MFKIVRFSLIVAIASVSCAFNALAAYEELKGFQLQACNQENSCLQIEATLAKKGYFSHLYMLRGRVGVYRIGIGNRVQLVEATEGYYDARRNFALLKLKDGTKSFGVDLNKAELLNFKN